MTINPFTGKITWTPAPGQTNSGNVTIKVTDESANLITQELHFQVTEQFPVYQGFFVAPDGNDNNDGSPLKPFKAL